MIADPLRRLAPVVRLAPAKLNLSLAVIGRGSDGYHALHTVMVPLALADRLSLAPNGASRDTLHVTGTDAGPDADNLALRAVAAARAAIGEGPGRPASPAAAATVPRRSTAPSRRGPRQTLSTGSVAPRSRHRSDRMCRSSWPVGRHWSKGAASA
jgi:hypothetical protein